VLEVVGSLDPEKSRSRATRTLFGIRYRLGEWLGWDDPQHALSIPESRETTLSARLPEDLRNTATSVELSTKDFIPLYRTDVEWAAEISNKTVHAVIHLAWVEKGTSHYQGQMGIYVKPRGKLGTAYMAAIAPFRHRIVYPALEREIERAWNTRMADQRSVTRGRHAKARSDPPWSGHPTDSIYTLDDVRSSTLLLPAIGRWICPVPTSRGRAHQSGDG
jgi:hypothetical protein